jgi:hypothetical protein
MLRREDLVDGQEGREDLAKVHREAPLQIPTEELGSEERGEVVDEHEEEDHVGEAVHIPEHGHEQRPHAGYLEDDAVETRELEDRQPRVHRRAVHDGELDDSRADREYEVEVVGALDEEAAPVGQVRDEADRNLDVERYRDHQFANVEDLLVRRADGHVSRGLENERGEGEGYPTPPDALVYFPDGVPPCPAATGVGSPRCLVLFVNE